MAYNLQHFLNFASNVPIYQGFYDKIYGYNVDDYNKIKDVTGHNNLSAVRNMLYEHGRDPYTNMFFMCTKSVCTLRDNDGLWVFGASSMINSIKLKPLDRFQ